MLLLFIPFIYPQDEPVILRVTYVGAVSDDETIDKTPCNYLIKLEGSKLTLMTDDETYTWICYGKLDKGVTDFTTKAIDSNGAEWEIYFSILENLDAVIAMRCKKGVLLYYCEIASGFQ